MFLAKNAGDFATEAKNTECIRTMRKRLVFDVENFVVQIAEDFVECFAWSCKTWVKLYNAGMIIAKCELIRTSHHAIRIIFFEHFAHANFEWLVVMEGRRNNCTRRNPCSVHALVDIWCAAHNLDVAIFVTRNVFCDAAVVDFTKR